MKVTIICATSLDGFINKLDRGKLIWGSTQDKQHFAKETRRTGVAIMGQTTFDTLDEPLPDRLNVVVTRTPKDNTDQVIYVDGKPRNILEDMEARGFSEVSVIGGSMINTLFMNAGVVTDLVITITPHIFGEGVPLFGNLDKDYNLELVEARPLGPGEILNHYKVK